MADAATNFFEELARGERVPAPNRLKATLRFDFEHPQGLDRWFVDIDHQDVSVSHRNAKADCVVRTDRDLFSAVLEGRMNAMAAMLRGLIGIEGDPTILMMFQGAFRGTELARPTKAVESRAGRS
jgi:putative sterol carrier protein